MGRTIGIWVSGLLGSGIIGGMVGDYLYRNDFNTPGGVFGFLAGLLVFTCLRLWLARKP